MVLNSIKKILVRSPNWVGDAVMATPVPAEIKQSFPGCEVHVLARPWAGPVWEQHPQVDRVILLPDRKQSGFGKSWKLLLRLRQEKYDCAFILPNSFSSAWTAFWANARERIGYATDYRSRLLTRKVAWNQEIQNWPRPKMYLNLVRAVNAELDLEPDWNFVLNSAPGELARAQSWLGKKNQTGCIGLAPGSVAASRRWPLARYAELADRLLAKGLQVVLVGSPADREAAEEVAKNVTRGRPLILAGKTNLREGMAVIRCLDLLVANDSGAMHLAYAQGVPVLVLQGAADAAVTGPFGKNSQVLRAGNLACAPCVRNDCAFDRIKCMEAITVAEVWEKVRHLLAKLKIKPGTNHG